MCLFQDRGQRLIVDNSMEVHGQSPARCTIPNAAGVCRLDVAGTDDVQNIIGGGESLESVEQDIETLRPHHVRQEDKPAAAQVPPRALRRHPHETRPGDHLQVAQSHAASPLAWQPIRNLDVAGGVEDETIHAVQIPPLDDAVEDVLRHTSPSGSEVVDYADDRTWMRACIARSAATDDKARLARMRSKPVGSRNVKLSRSCVPYRPGGSEMISTVVALLLQMRYQHAVIQVAPAHGIERAVDDETQHSWVACAAVNAAEPSTATGRTEVSRNRRPKPNRSPTGRP